MKNFKKIIMVLVLVATIVAPTVLPSTNLVAVAEAATVKLNKTSLTLDVGKTVQLKVTGTKSAVKWKSSNTAVATVSSKGNVTAKAAGKANITATVSKKTYTCKVKVKEVKKAETVDKSDKSVKSGDVTFVYPYNYVANAYTTKGDDGSTTYICDFTTASDTANLIGKISYMDLAYPWFMVKAGVKKNEDTLKQRLKDNFLVSASSITDIKSEEYKTSLSDSTLLITYNAKTSDSTGKGMELYIKKDGNLFILYAIDFGNGDILKDMENIFNSMK